MTAANSGDGDLCVLLHSHMPYVEGFGRWPFGEEWLLEAMAACYVPLVRLLERRAERGETALLTVGVTPVLADQLALPAVGERFVEFMRGVRRECHRLDSAGLEADGQHGAAGALGQGALDYEHAADEFEAMPGGLLGGLRRLAAAGAVELWTSAATHAVLPLIATGQGAALQLRTGIAAHRERFGAWTGGFWLPECAYFPGCEEALAAEGVRAFCVYQPSEAPALDRLEPVLTPAGAIALPVDWATVELAWADAGYPNHPAYRDYHRQTHNGMRAWANSGAPYDRDAADAQARADARRFVAAVADRMGRFRAEHGRRGLLVFAVDTELLGHWWFEGLWWLEHVLDEARAAGIGLATLPRALECHDPVRRELRSATWGDGKDMRTWDSPGVAHFANAQRSDELRLVQALSGGTAMPAPARSAAERAARELLALQASDWTFIRTRGLAGDYPDERISGHRAEFERAMRDFRAMRDQPPASQRGAPASGELRGLAPQLRLASLAGPPGSWGRP